MITAAGALPIDDVGDGHLELVGSFVEMVDRLHTFVRAAADATSVADWTTALGRAVHGLTASSSDDAWRVLLALHTDERIDLHIHDAGAFHVLVPVEELADGRYEHVVCSVDSG